MKCRDASEAIGVIRALEAELAQHLSNEYPVGATVYYEHGSNVREGVVETHSGADHGRVLVMRPSGSRKWVGVMWILRCVPTALAAEGE